VWAIDFQFDSTVDGKAIKIASMIDEHTRVSLLISLGPLGSGCFRLLQVKDSAGRGIAPATPALVSCP
jgi:hypothetical protein